MGHDFPVRGDGCWIAFFIIWRKQKARGLDTQETASPMAALRQKNIRRLSVFLMVAVSLSGPGGFLHRPESPISANGDRRHYHLHHLCHDLPGRVQASRTKA